MRIATSRARAENTYKFLSGLRLLFVDPFGAILWYYLRTLRRTGPTHVRKCPVKIADVRAFNLNKSIDQQEVNRKIF